MWQVVNLIDSISPSLIDSQSITFNFSAWVGGFDLQDDAAQVSLAFLDQNNTTLASITTLGPVLSSHRSDITSLMFQQAIGLVPVGARSFLVMVNMTRTYGVTNDGSVDNIIVAF